MKRRDFTKLFGAGGAFAFLPAILTKNNSVLADEIKNEGTIRADSAGEFDITPKFIALDSTRLAKKVREALNDPKFRRGLLFVSKTPIVDCHDDEIIGNFKGQVYAADIIGDDDQSAVVYETGLFHTSSSIPNIKIGHNISNGMMNRLSDFDESNEGKKEFLLNWETHQAKNLARGLLTRIDTLMAAMYSDNLAYDRLGVKFESSWGMPRDLNLETENKNLVRTIKELKALGKTQYKKRYNHMMLSSKTFLNLAMLLNLPIKRDKRGLLNMPKLLKLAARKLNLKTIEINDTTFLEKAPNGIKQRNRILPQNKIILTSTKDHNNPNACDFANGITTESVYASIVGIPSITKKEFGPSAYYTGGVDMNPPILTGWAVMRGFPRRHDAAMSAVITIKDDAMFYVPNTKLEPPDLNAFKAHKGFLRRSLI